jgi:hypothetical protein
MSPIGTAKRSPRMHTSHPLYAALAQASRGCFQVFQTFLTPTAPLGSRMLTAS